MSEKIVVGVTGAPVAQRAVDWAVAHAAAGGEIELVSIVGGAVGAVGEAELVRTAHEATQRLLDEHAARVQAAGIAVTTRVDQGNPVAVLVDASEGAALLVIGSDYRGPDTGAARGAHGIRISAAAHSAVVVVPDIDTAGRTGVLVGTDGSDVSAAAVRFAAAEAVRLGEPLVAVSVWTPVPIPGVMGSYPEPYLGDMNEVTGEILKAALAEVRAAHPNLQIIEQVECGYPSAIINELAQDARLAVLGSHGRGALARLLLGSISHEVLARLATVTAIVR
ncbi:hypothetical protein GCM10022240_07400 [Microbacterium kribbense]|uniref:UspA domain-containing protein n=1 Tax=Microbacterium kribbense TaxID=433645 RepID=A0ABP7G8B3_9MICO